MRPPRSQPEPHGIRVEPEESASRLLMRTPRMLPAFLDGKPTHLEKTEHLDSSRDSPGKLSRLAVPTCCFNLLFLWKIDRLLATVDPESIF